MVHVARQAVSVVEHALYDGFAQIVLELEVLAVGFEAWSRLGVLLYQRVLPVVGLHAIEHLAGRLFANFYVGIALCQFLAERGHAEHAASCQR